MPTLKETIQTLKEKDNPMLTLRDFILKAAQDVFAQKVDELKKEFLNEIQGVVNEKVNESVLGLTVSKFDSQWKGDKGDAPAPDELTQLIKPLIPPLIPRPIPGKDGADFIPDAFYKQNDVVSCGEKACQSILAMYGFYNADVEINLDNGTSPTEIRQELKRFGVDVKFKDITFNSLVPRSIAWYPEEDHYVTIQIKRDNEIYINDGLEKSPRWISQKDFEKKWLDKKGVGWVVETYPLIPKDGTPGINGEAPTKEELTSLIKPLIPKVEDGSPDNPKDIAKKLNTLTKVIEMSVIKGLEDRFGTVLQEIKSKFKQGGGGGDSLQVTDLSASLNGVTKTFTLPAHRKIVLVTGSSSPFGAFRPATDFTHTRTTITFTANVDETVSLASGQSLLIIYTR